MHKYYLERTVCLGLPKVRLSNVQRVQCRRTSRAHSRLHVFKLSFTVFQAVIGCIPEKMDMRDNINKFMYDEITAKI